MLFYWLQEITLEEYVKVLEEATKVEKRKVDTKAFEAMQQFSSKKSNNDEVFIKLVSYIGGYRGRESRVPREELIEEVVDQEEPTEVVGDQEETTGEGDQMAAAPKIEDAGRKQNFHSPLSFIIYKKNHHLALIRMKTFTKKFIIASNITKYL